MHIMAVVLIGLTSTGTLNARTSGDDDDYKTKTYEVGEISSIDANGLFSVVYEQTSGATEVAVKTKDKVFECLEVKNDDGMLVLKLNLKEGKSYSFSPSPHQASDLRGVVGIRQFHLREGHQDRVPQDQILRSGKRRDQGYLSQELD